MIGYEVFRNGIRLCVAGVREGVFDASMTWVSRGAGSPEPWSLDLRVGGLTNGEHVDWLIERLNVGDEIAIKVRETEEVDAPKDLRPQGPSRRPEDRARHVKEVLRRVEARAADTRAGVGCEAP